MNQKTKLILIVTIFAVVGTIFAFSGSKNNFCRNLLAIGNTCVVSLFGESNTTIYSNEFTYSSEPILNFTLGVNTYLVNLEDREVSFFKVPLVCKAAPAIGCGSRAKPILSSFESSPNVKEAWLNKGGTTIAVVWKDGLDVNTKKEIANTVFSKHKLDVSEISSNDYVTTLKSFETHEGWLKGSEVDKLSKEEASIFADRLIKTIKENSDISTSHAKKIRQKIIDGFYDLFINYGSLNELGDPNTYKSILNDVII